MPFVLDKFLSKWNLDGARLAAASGLDHTLVSRLKSRKRSANVAHVEALVTGARRLLKNKAIDASDFVFVEGGEQVEKKTPGKQKRVGPYGEVKGDSIGEIIRGYVGNNGEQLVPLMVDIAHDNVTEEVPAKGDQKATRVRVPQKAHEQAMAIKWLTDNGEFKALEGGGAGNMDVYLQLFDEEKNLHGEHRLIFTPAVADHSSASIPAEGVSKALLEGAVS